MIEYPANSEAQLVELFVPGRLCLFGEHSDWAADYGIHRGFCIVTGQTRASGPLQSKVLTLWLRQDCRTVRVGRAVESGE